MAKEKVTTAPQEDSPAQGPSKEQVIAFFQEQIEVKKVQLELQELNTRLAVARAEELKALSFIAQMTTPKPAGDEYEGGVPHKITQEDLDNNPELVEQGFSVGDEVIIPAEHETKKERTLKK
jgi:hypothetical protein